MWKLLLDKLVVGIYLDLSIVLCVSVLLSLKVSTVALGVCGFSVLSTVSNFLFDEIRYVLTSLPKLFSDCPYFSTVSIFVFVAMIGAPSLTFLCFFEGKYSWYFSSLSTLGCSRTVACFFWNFELQVFQFHLYCYPTWD